MVPATTVTGTDKERQVVRGGEAEVAEEMDWLELLLALPYPPHRVSFSALLQLAHPVLLSSGDRVVSPPLSGQLTQTHTSMCCPVKVWSLLSSAAASEGLGQLSHSHRVPL